MKIYYVWDAYCGWSYGFNQAAVTFLKNHPEIDLDMISGGLFWGDNTKRLADYQKAKEINQRIHNHYGVAFGDSYQVLFDNPDFTMNSLGSARAFAILRNHLPKEQWAPVSFDMQKRFFVQGQDLNQASSYAQIIEQYGLDQEILTEIEHALQEPERIHPDFVKTAQMGVQGFPTMILENDDKYYLLSGQARTAEDLEAHLQTILNER